MLSKITRIVLAALALAAVAASAGPNESADIPSSSSERIATGGGAGGNLVPRW